MPLPASGSISLSQVNVELGVASTTAISMNQATVRTLFGVPSGAISMSNGYGKSAGPTVIGQAFGGGFYAGKIAVGGGGIATHYLIVAPRATGAAVKKWETSNATNTPGTFSLIDGPANSAAMGPGNSAGVFCNDLTIGGYTDWYLPAVYELEICYYFLKPTTTANAFNQGAPSPNGANPYAVSPEPINTIYTAGSPARTSAAAFISPSGTEYFYGDGSQYWASTSFSGAPTAWRQNFATGRQDWYYKNTETFARAVRRVPI